MKLYTTIPDEVLERPCLKFIAGAICNELKQEEVFLEQGTLHSYNVRFKHNTSYFHLDGCYPLEKPDGVHFYIGLVRGGREVWHSEFDEVDRLKFRRLIGKWLKDGFPTGSTVVKWTDSVCSQSAVDMSKSWVERHLNSWKTDGWLSGWSEDELLVGDDVSEEQLEESAKQARVLAEQRERQLRIAQERQVREENAALKAMQDRMQKAGVDPYAFLQDDALFASAMKAKGASLEETHTPSQAWTSFNDMSGTTVAGSPVSADVDTDGEERTPDGGVEQAGDEDEVFVPESKLMPREDIRQASLVPATISRVRVVALRYNKQTIGYRFKTDAGAFDMRLETATTYGLVALKTETVITLENVNGILMSASERKSHTCVPDISDCKADCDRLVKIMFRG